MSRLLRFRKKIEAALSAEIDPGKYDQLISALR
jgi:hypothetical protein